MQWPYPDKRKRGLNVNTELITKTENFLNQKFDDSEYFKAHPDEKAYRLEHSYRVGVL